MKLMDKFYSLLALLLVGSASLQAQDTDPFPDVNFRLYPSNITITAQVVQNNQVVTDALVAVYCGDEIRGKGSVGAGTRPDIVFLTVYGDYQGEYQYMHFKVYTEGKIFTYNPNPPIDWEDCFVYNDQMVGKVSSPYIIDITPVSLANDADNTTTLTTWKNKTCDVALTDRTLTKDGNWNTLCLPFNLGDAEAEADHHYDGTPLEGAVVKELNASASNLTANGTLTLNFTDADAIEAGKPYIVKWENASGTVSNPVFTGVTISSTTPTPVEFSITNSDDKCEFVGQYSPFSIVTSGATGDDEGNLNEIIMLSSGSRLGYSKNPRTLNTFRCHFYVPAKDGVQQARAFVMDFGDGETTGILPIDHSPLTIEHTADVWYTIDGMKLDNVPTKKGVYIVNGKKVKR